jgi:8-oxo-dGTP pyrophosphatase MutT (NUDIX family)
MAQPTHAGLTADMFVIRDGRFLTLTRGPGRGEGVEYLPGGIVDPGEDPLDAAVRETLEETGLVARDAAVLRVWTYPTPEGFETIHATFVGWSDVGDVVISSEHTGHRWTAPDDYIAHWCHTGIEERFPEHAVWARQVRRNCEIIRDLLAVT